MKLKDYFSKVLPQIRSIIVQRETGNLYLLQEELKNAIPVEHEATLLSILKELITPYEHETIVVDIDGMDAKKYFDVVTSYKVRGIGIVGCSDVSHCIRKLRNAGFDPRVHTLELYIGNDGIYEVIGYDRESDEVMLNNVFDTKHRFTGHSYFLKS